MKSIVLKVLLCLVTTFALAGCVDFDPRGRGPIVLPPPGVGQNGGERRHADEQGEDREKEKHRHKDKHKDDDDGDGDDDGDDHHRGRHHKD